MVSTLDFESSDPSSNLGRTCAFSIRCYQTAVVERLRDMMQGKVVVCPKIPPHFEATKIPCVKLCYNRKDLSEVGFEPTPTFVDQNTHSATMCAEKVYP